MCCSECSRWRIVTSTQHATFAADNVEFRCEDVGRSCQEPCDDNPFNDNDDISEFVRPGSGSGGGGGPKSKRKDKGGGSSKGKEGAKVKKNTAKSPKGKGTAAASAEAAQQNAAQQQNRDPRKRPGAIA